MVIIECPNCLREECVDNETYDRCMTLYDDSKDDLSGIWMPYPFMCADCGAEMIVIDRT